MIIDKIDMILNEAAKPARIKFGGDVAAKIKHKGHTYELKKSFRWGGLLTHIVYKDGKEIAQEAPNLKSEIAIKRFKDNVKKNGYAI